ncbi:protein phosphatase regulatory subunit [Amanita muscaria]
MENDQEAPVVDSRVKNVTAAKSGGKERIARVELPEPAVDAGADSDEEPAGEDEKYEQDDDDFLVDFPDETEDLELVHLRIGLLDNLRLPRFAKHLKRLCLRQNVITHLDPEIFHPLANLEELDLYDNKVKHLGDALDNLSNLQTLDLSFNLFKTIPERLEFVKQVETIYFVQNRISKISGLSPLTKLRSLELGGNRIRKIENLEELVNLEELWLGKNKISKIEGLSTLKKLRILSMQSNRITKLEGVEGLESLEELYLSHNGIKKLEGLDNNLQLTTLDVGNNFIEVLENVSHLKTFAELWMNHNLIPDLRALDTQLRSIASLETLYLEGNPCQTTDMANYRRKVKLALPQLKQIDATFVKID